MGLAATLVVVAPSSAEAVTPNLDPQHTRSAVRLGSLTSLAAQRILLGDKVAAAKFGTDQPIDDPSRERHELDAVAALAAREGVDPDASVRFFRAQIEANKVVQRGLYALWADGRCAPDLFARASWRSDLRPGGEHPADHLGDQGQIELPVRGLRRRAQVAANAVDQHGALLVGQDQDV
jgi:chorismate mutase-like protein